MCRHGWCWFDLGQRGAATGGSDAADRRGQVRRRPRRDRACSTWRSSARTVAHGTINSVDVSEAESMPGVVAVYHAGNDLGMPAMQGFPMMPPDYNRPIFASERVRFVGDVVAAVVAESQAQADDAAEQVIADIDAAAGRPDAPPTGWRPTPRCCSPSTARTSASPPSSARTAATRARAPTRSPRSRWSASVSPACRWRTTASSPFPRTAGSRCGCRTRRRTRSTARYAPMLGLEPEQLRIVCPWVGGGFGPKAAGYVEYLDRRQGRARRSASR